MTDAPAEIDAVATEAPQGEPDEPLGEPGKKALTAEREARKVAEKAASELTERLRQIEDAQLSEIERAKKEAAEAKATLEEVTRENLRSRVALAKGVPADLAEFLTGDTEEAIARQADVLLSRLNVPSAPRPDPSQGSAGGKVSANPADAFVEFFQNRF